MHVPRLEEGQADEFRVQVKAAIQKIWKPKSNITRGEREAIAELQKDPSRMVLTADKGVALVVDEHRRPQKESRGIT